MSFYKKIEEALQARQASYLKHVEFYNGQEIKVYEITQDEYSRVYGRSAGKISSDYFLMTAVVVDNDVIPLGPRSAGSFTTGVLYTSDPHSIKAGQIIEIQSQDGRSRRFTVKKTESYGMTTNVFYRYEILAIGD